MIRFPAYTRLLFIILALVMPLGPGRAEDSESDSRHGWEQEAFSLINQYRKDKGLPSLRWDDEIAQVARAHSRDMATGRVDFGHDGFIGRVGELKTVMIGLKGAGENVFKTNELREAARLAVESWLKSPPHLHNIRGDYNYSGLGAWDDGQGMIYFTQIFVKIVPRAEAVQSPSGPEGIGLGLPGQPYGRF